MENFDKEIRSALNANYNISDEKLVDKAKALLSQLDEATSDVKSTLAENEALEKQLKELERQLDEADKEVQETQAENEALKKALKPKPAIDKEKLKAVAKDVFKRNKTATKVYLAEDATPFLSLHDARQYSKSLFLAKEQNGSIILERL